MENIMESFSSCSANNQNIFGVYALDKLNKKMNVVIIIISFLCLLHFILLFYFLNKKI